MAAIWSAFLNVTFGILIVTYMLFGAAYAVLLVTVGLNAAADNPTMGPGIAQLRAAASKKRLGQARFRLATRLFVPLSCITTWPSYLGVMAAGVQLKPKQEYESRTRQLLLKPRRISRELSALLFVICAALAYSVAGPHWYVRLACYTSIVAAMSALLANLLWGSSLEEQLLQEHRSPQLQFALIAAANFAVVTIAAYVLTRWTPGSAFQFDGLIHEGQDVLTGSHVRSVWDQRNEGATQILIALSSVLLYSLLLSRLKIFTQLRRSDEDRLALGLRYLWAGDREKAERWLGPVRRKHGKVEAVQAEFALALAASDYDRALKQAEVLWSLQGRSEKDSDANDEALRLMLIIAIQVLDAERAKAVMRYVIDHEMTDACLSMCLEGFLVARQLAGDRYTEARIQSFGFSDPPYPLTMAKIDEGFGYFNAVEERLKAFIPGRIAEDAIKRLMLSNASMMLAHDSRSDYVAAAHRATEDYLAQVAELPRSESPLWLIQTLAAAARGLAVVAREVGSEASAKELDRAFDRLMGDEAKSTSVLMDDLIRRIRL
jgi:hypothetical protein